MYNMLILVQYKFFFCSKNVQCTKETSDLSLIYGEAYLYEDLLGRKFRISPDSFFYINVEATKVLCEEVMKIAEFNQSVTLLDICCGVGKKILFNVCH